MAAIDIDNISKFFSTRLISKKQVLHSISLSALEHKITGFIGLNGAGKSTLINLTMGFTFPDSGSITIFGENPANPATRKKVGYLPEHTRFQEHLTGWQLLRYAGLVADLSRETIHERGTILLDKLSLSDAGNNQIRSYSKGMKQRLGLALALLPDPDLYILDEPMSGLDPLGRQMVKTLILDEKKRGKSVFFSSHILNDIESLCDNIIIIRQGKILYSGSVENFCSNNDLESKFIELHIECEAVET